MIYLAILRSLNVPEGSGVLVADSSVVVVIVSVVNSVLSSPLVVDFAPVVEVLLKSVRTATKNIVVSKRTNHYMYLLYLIICNIGILGS